MVRDKQNRRNLSPLSRDGYDWRGWHEQTVIVEANGTAEDLHERAGGCRMLRIEVELYSIFRIVTVSTSRVVID